MNLAHEDLLDRWSTALVTAKRAALGGGAVLAVLLVCVFFWPHAVLRSYLFAYVFWLNVAVGSLGWLMLGHVTGGAWGRSTRRVFEAAAGTLPLLAVLGIPLLLGASHLYAWADAGEWMHDPVVAHRRPWVAFVGVAVRAVVSFAAWIWLATTLRRLSVAQDAATDNDTILTLGKRMRTISQGGCCVLFVTVELLAVDWIMSLEPHWISSIFGLLILCGQTTAAMAGAVLVLAALQRRGGRPLVSDERVHDLGKLLMTSLILWAYMNFFQYLMQWIGDTQEDIRWYVQRLHGGWSVVAGSLCVLHLGVPLALLLSKPLKRSLKSLAVVAACIFVMRVVDILWTIAPSGPHETVGPPYVTDPLAWLAIGGPWAGAYVWVLSRQSLRSRAFLTSGENVSGVVIGGVAEGVSDAR